MSKAISSLHVGLFSDVSQFVRGIGSEAVGAVKGLGSAVKGAGASLMSFAGPMALISGAISGIVGIGEALKANAELEKTSVALEALTGSAGNARDILEATKAIAEKSPFRFPELNEAAKQLAVFGVSADQIGPQLKVLSDLAAGTGTPIKELADLYGRMREKGVGGAREIKEMMNSGIPIIAALSRELGVSEIRANELAKAGQISFPQIQKALIALTSEGGRFEGMAEKQSHEIGAVWDRLKDNVSDSLGTLTGRIISTFHITQALEALSSGANRLVDLWDTGLGYVADIAGSAWGTISDEVVGLWDDIVAVWDFGTNLITGQTLSVGQVAGGVWDGIVQGANWMGNAIVTAFRFTEFALTHWKESLIIVGLEAGLFGERTGGQLKYVFTEVIPDSIMFMNKHSEEVFTDLWRYVAIGMTNMTDNLINVFSNLPGLLTKTVKWGDVWKPMEREFQSSITSTFKLPDRVKSDLETSLTADLDTLTKAYGQGLGTFLDEKAKHSTEVARKTSDAIKSFFGIDVAAKTPHTQDLNIKPKIDPTSGVFSVTPEIKRAGLLKYGSAEAAAATLDFYTSGSVTAGSGGDNARVPEKIDKSNDWLFKIWFNSENPKLAVASF